jgi:hypothetical protein
VFDQIFYFTKFSKKKLRKLKEVDKEILIIEKIFKSLFLHKI